MAESFFNLQKANIGQRIDETIGFPLWTLNENILFVVYMKIKEVIAASQAFNFFPRRSQSLLEILWAKIEFNPYSVHPKITEKVLENWALSPT